jgi:hypothetical protein
LSYQHSKAGLAVWPTASLFATQAAQPGLSLLLAILSFGRNTMRTRVVSLLLIVVGSLFLAACPPHVSTARLNQNPGRYASSEVTIAGRVVDSFGALGRGVFELDDGTGTMWVLAGQYGVPAAGAKLAVTGRAEQGFSFAGRNFATILRETERRH